MADQSAVGIARRLVMALRVLGVRDAVLSPGSRSGPLALALHAADRQGILRLHVRVDEREAAFLALGLAKAQHGIVPVVTTSGTAVANLHPAMLEARHAGIGLLAVTADRPARLRGTGANQTTHQPGLFPGIGFTDRVSALTSLVSETRPGHLNLELDEPLVEPFAWDFPQTGAPGHVVPSITRTRVPAGRGVVVAGDGAGPEAEELAAAAGLPLLAEPSSGARHGAALPAYRLLLEELGADVEHVLSFGHATLSRPVTRLLARTDIAIHHVGDQTTFPVPAGPNVTFCAGVEIDGAAADGWLERWQRASAAAVEALPPSDALVAARAVWDASDGGLLVVGASNPVRYVDLVADGGRRTVLANRGLAGIDGTLSTAIGAALAVPGPALAIVGDLTFLHGSNGLLLGPAEPRPDLTIVVLNDDGGAIFHGLEQGGDDYADAFERVWGTPTGADLAALCRGFGVAHERVTASGLGAVLGERPRGVSVVEVPLVRGRTAM